MTALKKVAELIAADDTARLLAEAVASNPGEASPAAQLADRLQELGASPKSAKSHVKEIVLSNTPVSQWPKAELSKLLRGTTLAAITAAVTTANGRRRERTLTVDDCLRICARARKNRGASWVGGGNVANAYGYRAEQTGFIAVVRTDGQLRFAAGVVNASKGASVPNTLIGVAKNQPLERFFAWADSVA